MKSEFLVQVDKSHYYDGIYDNLESFVRYFYQIDLTRKLKINNILEIGVGNKTVSNYLKQNGYNVTTCDFDKELNPDYVADIRALPFNDNSFDLTMASEVLEHLPWHTVEAALSELHRVTNKYTIISVPYASVYFEIILKSSFMKKILKKPFLRAIFSIPAFFSKIELLNGEHYWEIGRKNYPIKKVRELINTRFKIVEEFRPPFTFQEFFVLEKIS